MRITKKWLRDHKHGLNRRVMELCVLGATGRLTDEYFRVFPAKVGNVPTDHNDFIKLRELLSDFLELAVPQHFVE